MSTQPVLDLDAQVRAVVETAIRDLTRLGMEREGAAAVLCVQGAVRIVDREQLRGLRRTLDDLGAADGQDEDA